MKKVHFKWCALQPLFVWLLAFVLVGCHTAQDASQAAAQGATTGYHAVEAGYYLAAGGFTVLHLDNQRKVFIPTEQLFMNHSANPSSRFKSLMAGVGFAVKESQPRYVSVTIQDVSPKQPLERALSRQRMQQVVASLSASGIDARFIYSQFSKPNTGSGLDYFTVDGVSNPQIEIAYGS